MITTVAIQLRMTGYARQHADIATRVGYFALGSALQPRASMPGAPSLALEATGAAARNCRVGDARCIVLRADQ
jgi:hypothetical protein